jgi:drug/metabolite transporter (DMT)-like permease
VLAAALQGGTVLAVGQLAAVGRAPGRDVALILVSGVVGLTIGDTALFSAVARIGVHRTLLLQTLAPMFAALLAVAAQGERLNARQLGGAATILAGIALVVAPRRGAGEGASAGGWRSAGVALAVLAALGQGGGVVLAKAGVGHIPVLAASFLRLAAAAAGLVVVEAWSRRLGRLGALAGSRPTLARVLPATLLGTYLALFLAMAGVAWAPASVAAVLLATAPVFSLVLEVTVHRRPVSAAAVGGTLLAVAGVALLVS